MESRINEKEKKKFQPTPLKEEELELHDNAVRSDYENK